MDEIFSVDNQDTFFPEKIYEESIGIEKIKMKLDSLYRPEE